MFNPLTRRLVWVNVLVSTLLWGCNSASTALTAIDSKASAPTPTPTGAATPKPVARPLKSKTGLVIKSVLLVEPDVIAVLKNLGESTIDLNAEQWKYCGSNYIYGRLSKTKSRISPNAEIRLHLNTHQVPCTDTDTDFCAELGMGIGAEFGSLALYRGVPDGTTANFSNEAHLMDYVEWGKAAQAREDIAAKAGVWVEGSFIGIIKGQTTQISTKVLGASGAGNWQ